MWKIKALSPQVLRMEDEWYEKSKILMDLRWYWIQTRTYIVNRFLRKTWKLKLKSLNKGRYYAPEHLMFEACFQVLVNYVEVECAWLELISTGSRRWYHRYFGVPSSRERGLRYLSWEIQLGNDSLEQSQAAKIARDLYLWYKDVYPNHISARKSMDLPAPDFDKANEGWGMTDDDWKLHEEADKKDIEWENIKTLNLIQLIQIRRMLWT